MKLMLVKQILHISTLGIVWRTVRRFCILMLSCKGLKGAISIKINATINSVFQFSCFVLLYFPSTGKSTSHWRCTMPWTNHRVDSYLWTLTAPIFPDFITNKVCLLQLFKPYSNKLYTKHLASYHMFCFLTLHWLIHVGLQVPNVHVFMA